MKDAARFFTDSSCWNVNGKPKNCDADAQ